MKIGMTNVEGGGSAVAATLLAAGIHWGRSGYEGSYSINNALAWGFDVLACCGNIANGTSLLTLNNETHAANTVSSVQSQNPPHVFGFMNEPYYKDGQAHPVKYGRLYMAALSALRAAGYAQDVLFQGTGAFQVTGTSQSNVSLTSGNSVITLPNGTDELVIGQGVSGTGIVGGTTISALNADAIHATLSQAPNQTTTSTLTFQNAYWSDPGNPNGGWIARACLTVSGLKDAIIANGIELHPYGMPTEDGTGHSYGIAAVASQRSHLTTLLGVDPKLWIGEMGYYIDGVTQNASTGTNVYDEAEQALRMGQAFDILRASPLRNCIQGIFQYQLDDGGWGCTGAGYTPRQSFDVISDAAIAEEEEEPPPEARIRISIGA